MGKPKAKSTTKVRRVKTPPVSTEKEYQVFRLVGGQWVPQYGPQKSFGRKALMGLIRADKKSPKVFKVRVAA